MEVYFRTPIFCVNYPKIIIYLLVIELIHGHGIYSCWVELTHPMNMVINTIRTRLGRGLIFVLVPRQGPPLIFGVNVPDDFGSITLFPHGNQWTLLRFTYVPLVDDSDEDVVIESVVDVDVRQEELREGGTLPGPSC